MLGVRAVRARGLGGMALTFCVSEGLWERSAVDLCELWTSMGPMLGIGSVQPLRVGFPMIEKSQGISDTMMP